VAWGAGRIRIEGDHQLLRHRSVTFVPLKLAPCPSPRQEKYRSPPSRSGSSGREHGGGFRPGLEHPPPPPPPRPRRRPPPPPPPPPPGWRAIDDRRPLILLTGGGRAGNAGTMAARDRPPPSRLHRRQNAAKACVPLPCSCSWPRFRGPDHRCRGVGPHTAATGSVWSAPGATPRSQGPGPAPSTGWNQLEPAERRIRTLTPAGLRRAASELGPTFVASPHVGQAQAIEAAEGHL